VKLLFEKGAPGRALTILPKLDVPAAEPEKALLREKPARLANLSETEISRHYTELAKRTHGVNDGFYPLGSCTMKYNPKIDDEMAALPGFAGIHPLQPEADAQGCLEVLFRLGGILCEVTGMDGMTFQPAAGAHGEQTGLLTIKAYHKNRGDLSRTKVIVPDSAHGTNPASATMAGMTVVSIPSGPDGCVDLEALKKAVGSDTAGLMLTNPNTLGIFDHNILEITRIVHEAGGLCYYDGANLNAVMGVVRPGDMGFDVVHLNLHKTFATPHGGGGPGAGAVGVKACLKPFLPGPQVEKTESGYRFTTPEHSIGAVKAFYGNFLVVVRALTYALTLGADGMKLAATTAVLNANYMMAKLKGAFDMASGEICMHEFVMSLEKLKKETGVSALDVAKAMLDEGMHPPTMYFPMIVHEALMLEPTETESRETLDEAVNVLLQIRERAYSDPEGVKACPVKAPIGRPDEVAAARNPKIRYAFPE
jgi:glycine dehydrogenase subunit 2